MSPALQLTTPTPPFPKLVMQKPSPLVASVLWASSDSWASSSCLATSAQTRQVRQCKADLEIAHHHEEEMQLKLESAEQSRYSEASLDLSSSDSPPLSGPLTPPPPPPPIPPSRFAEARRLWTQLRLKRTSLQLRQRQGPRTTGSGRT